MFSNWFFYLISSYSFNFIHFVMTNTEMVVFYFIGKQQESVEEKRKNILNVWKTEFLY